MNYLKDSLTLLFTIVAVGSLVILMSAAAGAQQRMGWQVHVSYAGTARTITIGPPFPTRQLCEDIRFPIMIEMISDKVECRQVVDSYNRD